jgi:hypothetical protein
MVRVKRDWLPPATALLLGLVAVPATGWLSVAPLPTTLSALARIAAWLLSLMLLAAALRGPRGLGVGRPLAVLLAALPCFALIVLAGPPGLASTVPWRGLAVLLVICLVTVTAEGEAARRVAVGVVGAFLLLASFVPTVGVGPFLPARWNPLAHVARLGAPPGPAPQTSPVRGAREHVAAAPRPAHPLGIGEGPWYSAVTTVPERLVFPLVGTVGTVEAPETGEATFRPVPAEGLGHPFDLDAYDALLVGPDALEALPKVERRTAAGVVAQFVRAGGLLLGPGPDAGWSPDLARALGEAGKSPQVGYDGRRYLGLGAIIHPADAEDVARLLGMDLWVPPIQTVFRRVGVPPPPPAGFPRWHDAPRRRRATGALLLGAGLLLLLLVWVARTPVLALSVLAGWALAVSAGIWLVAPREVGFVTQGAVLELGGPGGRRTEVVWLSAGPGGYRGAVGWHQGPYERTGPGRVARPETGGFVRVLGGVLDAEGRVVVAPGQGAWILRERLAPGGDTGDPPPVGAPTLRDLLRGPIDPKQVSRGHVERLPISVAGSGPIPAAILRVHRP